MAKRRGKYAKSAFYFFAYGGGLPFALKKQKTTMRLSIRRLKTISKLVNSRR